MFFFIGCLIELKFCELSRNSFKKSFEKFQLSILKSKKVLFLKKMFFKPRYIQKMVLAVLIFSEGFHQTVLLSANYALSVLIRVTLG